MLGIISLQFGRQQADMDCPFSVPVSIIGKYQNKYLHMEVGVNVFPIVTLNSFTCHTDSLFSYWHMVIECVLPIENINDYVEQSNLWI